MWYDITYIDEEDSWKPERHIRTEDRKEFIATLRAFKKKGVKVTDLMTENRNAVNHTIKPPIAMKLYKPGNEKLEKQLADKKILGQVRKRFVKLCWAAGKEYLLDEYNLDNWTLRDYVSECQAEMESQSEYDRPDIPLINRYKRFVNTYKDKIDGIYSNERHFSKYDMKKPAPREVERWVTFHGRRIPIFKKDNKSPEIKGIVKNNISKLYEFKK